MSINRNIMVSYYNHLTEKSSMSQKAMILVLTLSLPDGWPQKSQSLWA